LLADSKHIKYETTILRGVALWFQRHQNLWCYNSNGCIYYLFKTL